MEFKSSNTPQEAREEFVNPLNYKELVVKIITPVIRTHPKAKTDYVEVEFEGKPRMLKLGASVVKSNFDYNIKNSIYKAGTVVRIVSLGIPAGKKYTNFDFQYSDGLPDQTRQSIPQDTTSTQTPQKEQAQGTTQTPVQAESLYVCVVCNMAYFTPKELNEHQNKLQHKGMRVKPV